MDIYAEITNRIMEQMENGVIPWRKPWVAAGSAISHATGKSYSLLNQMLLGRPGEYLTFKQVQAEGGKVRKGAKAQMVVFWKWITVEDVETQEEKEGNLPRFHPLQVGYVVLRIGPCIIRPSYDDLRDRFFVGIIAHTVHPASAINAPRIFSTLAWSLSALIFHFSMASFFNSSSVPL